MNHYAKTFNMHLPTANIFEFGLVSRTAGLKGYSVNLFVLSRKSVAPPDMVYVRISPYDHEIFPDTVYRITAHSQLSPETAYHSHGGAII